MAEYALSGTGVQLLSAGTTRLFVAITAASAVQQDGEAHPVNRYHQGLLRAGVGDYYFPPIPVDADQQVIDLPSGTDRIGYALFGGGAIILSEVNPVVPPATYSFTDNTVAVSSTYTDTQDVTKWQVWQINDPAYRLVALRLLVPAGATYTTLHFGLWLDGATGFLYEADTPTLIEGWNQWTIPPVALTAATNYNLGYQSHAGIEGVVEPNPMTGVTVGPLTGESTNFDNAANWPGQPANYNYGSWYGIDVVVTTP